MRTVRRVKTLQLLIKKLKQRGKSIGFIPTMGALHKGHLSLIEKSKKECDITVLSIFVNPTQFGPNEDFAEYPREQKKDNLLAKKKKVDIIFYPSEKEMYPTGYLTSVDVGPMGDILCGKSRPGHFNGVATIVTKLLNTVGPDILYLGQKDIQQAVILQRMIRDLTFPVQTRVCPIIRENDGLAMSSRNRYLSPGQRKEATVLYQSLLKAKKKIDNGEHSASKVMRLIRSVILAQSSATIDYIACVERKNLRDIKTLKGDIIIALAAYWGKTRLIDNMILNIR